MADRSGAPHHALRVSGHASHFHGRAPPFVDRAPPPPAAFLHPADDPLLRHVHPLRQSALELEGRLAAQAREIHELLADNQRLAATHVALKQEFIAAQHELRVSASAATKARAEADVEVRGVYEKSLRLEAEARAVAGMRAELAQVSSDLQRLAAGRDEDVVRLQKLRGELARMRAEHGQAAAIMTEIEAMRKEIQKGRAAIEFEKKVHADNLEQSQMMEANMVLLAREVEKLRAELANAESRARAASAVVANPGSGHNGVYGNPDMAYGGSNYPHGYATQQVQGSADSVSQYGTGAVSHGAYGGQQIHPQR